ncbi:WW domain-binding protein 11 [Heterocephalus glaber]|uniref:WW domain-binding protein 11 n=1 Tax=Heterocephalus glaber TaxID=10181 RepID=G5BMS7_HETGA|nr:WW domain-binding protein 11 [Heterocephalus glaber]
MPGLRGPLPRLLLWDHHWAYPLTLLLALLQGCPLALLPGAPHQGYLPLHLQADDTSAATIKKKATASISAKPQITNPKAEITQFVPTARRVHQGNKGAIAALQRNSEDDSAVPLAKAAPESGPSVPVSVQTKDDVYEAFMKEMEGLLGQLPVPKQASVHSSGSRSRTLTLELR